MCVSCCGLPPAAETTNSCEYLPSNHTKATSLPSGLHCTRPQDDLRNVSCRCSDTFMTQTLATPPCSMSQMVRSMLPADGVSVTLVFGLEAGGVPLAPEVKDDPEPFAALLDGGHRASTLQGGAARRPAMQTQRKPLDLPKTFPKWGWEKKKGLRLIDVNPSTTRCRREDSNLHSLNGNQVLNLARLPVPPLRHAQEYLRPTPEGRQERGKSSPAHWAWQKIREESGVSSRKKNEHRIIRTES
jgi:hypothetical protein